MKILLMRHCLAATVEQSGVSYDAERPLTPEGCRHAELVADYLKKLGIIPSKILSTPFLRSGKTAQILSENLGNVPVVTSTQLMPGAGVDDLLGAISKNACDDEWVLAVAHEPDCSYMLAQLIIKADEFPRKVLPGDIYALTLSIEDQDAKAGIVSSFSPINFEKI
ncbi:MAG: histidine phosphatase family protein [Lentisphaeraceae bacterium]|nr:histidine phosphatase family protein [Lentisphaeraceae bacterium]